jgi:hypothetical protein
MGNSFEEAKGKERTEKEKYGDRNKNVYFYFFRIGILRLTKMKPGIGKPVRQSILLVSTRKTDFFL